MFRMAPLLALALFAATPAAAQGGGCHAIGEQIAAEQGGKLARAMPGEQDGQQVCVIVILQAGAEGERPRRVEIIVPRQ